jgi:hypothetical protein
VPLGFDLFQRVDGALPHEAVKVEGVLYVIHRQARAKEQPLRGDDVLEFFAFQAADLDVAFFDQAFEVPIDRADRNFELRCQGCLGGVGVLFNLFKDDQVPLYIGWIIN